MRNLTSLAFQALTVGLLSWTCCEVLAFSVSASRGDAKPESPSVESRTITVRIDRPFESVYAFLADPANWNEWAFGLGKHIRRGKDGWIADSDGGIAHVEFTPRNRFGVVDHTVIRPSGRHVYVPARWIENGSGCELEFTLFRETGMTDAQFTSDAGFVQRDLNGLKALLEKGTHP